ncbi:MAG: DUF6273 domain-containing protein [Lachnospiraceae bacterium]|nr:DUF6273 domain-containing protein [Lachnospiraceae bacterium]
MPFGGILVALTWGLGHWLSKGSLFAGIYTAIGGFVFGAFEQDNNEGNGAEAIEWIILSKEDGKALLISKDVLEYKPFEDDAMEADWESCSLRKWLNEEFYDNSFSDEDKLRFSAGEDAVFCLSLEEAQMNFGEYDLYSEANNCVYKIGYLCSPSEYAKRISHYSHWQIADEYNGLDSHTNPEGGKYLTMIDIYGDKLDDLDGKIIVAWWLRSQGGSGFSACYVSSNGFVGADNWLEMSDENHIGVRPAIYVTY